jgi:plastocyanin
MLKYLLSIICFAVITFPSISQTHKIQVLDDQNKGVANVVVYLLPLNSHQSVPSETPAVMDQIDTQFVPHILPVQKQSLVQFPNSDSIKHHVYSFSKAKTFELQLYKGLQADPLLFAEAGVVELGCNVHDWMLGYIYVVDTPYFSKTDKDGSVQLTVPEGEYRVKIWNPLIQDDLESLSTTIKTLASTKTVKHKIKLKQALLPNLHQYQQTDEFSDYD